MIAMLQVLVRHLFELLPVMSLNGFVPYLAALSKGPAL